MFSANYPFTLILSLVLVLSSSGLSSFQPAFGKDTKKVLHGEVKEQGYTLPKTDQGGPSLSRNDIDSAGDPFSGANRAADRDNSGMNQALDAPQEAFQSAAVKLPPPQKGFGLGANLDEFSGEQMKGVSDSHPGGQISNPIEDGTTTQNQPQTAANPNDPDSSPEMQLAWDAWHHRVAEAIFQRFNFFARAAFKYSPPLAVRVSYVVTRDGQVRDVKLLDKSTNVMYNGLISQVVKSIGGDTALLQFPSGSRRQTVEKFGTFTQNYGAEGFRYTTGDRETIAH